MLLDKHRKFVGCILNFELLTAANADFVLAFVTQVLNSKADISGSGEVKAAAKFLKEERTALLAYTKRCV